MSDNTILNPGTGGDVIATEDPGLGYKIPVSKIRIGAADIDGGDVTITNPFPIAITDGYIGQVTVKNSSVAATDIDRALVVALSPNSTGIVTPKKSTAANQTSIPASLSNITLLSSNSTRMGATVYNSSSGFLYLILGATASATSFTVPINPGGYYETPFNYSGIISGIWSNTDGYAMITELT